MHHDAHLRNICEIFGVASFLIGVELLFRVIEKESLVLTTNCYEEFSGELEVFVIATFEGGACRRS